MINFGLTAKAVIYANRLAVCVVKDSESGSTWIEEIIKIYGILVGNPLRKRAPA